jgi:DNA-binding NtrC family response regulator
MNSIHLLIVDDEERFLSTTKTLMEKRGVKTLTAASGTKALQILEEARVDVVVLDVKMPGMDGVETLKRIKQKYPLIEVIMLTGHASVDSAVDGMKLGAFDYVMKPCDINDILEKVKKSYDKKQAMEEKIRKVKIERIISHPMAVFEKNVKD